MSTASTMEDNHYTYPPSYIPDIQQGNWFDVTIPEELISTVVNKVAHIPKIGNKWKVCRLSHSTYLYQEEESDWKFIAKYYIKKVLAPTDEIIFNSANEYNRILQAIECGLETSQIRVVKPLGLWNGVLVLEYVAGLTIADLIASRRNQPGRLLATLRLSAQLLARLHNATKQVGTIPTIENVHIYTQSLIMDLVAKYALRSQTTLAKELTFQVDRWCNSSLMCDYLPAFAHGDPTTGNFLVEGNGNIVGIDWERAYIGDPASDLGILMAEIAFSFNKNSALPGEVESFLDQFTRTYLSYLDADWNSDALMRRALFYQAMCFLRIARSSSHSDVIQWQLIAQALGKLSAL